MVQWETPIYLTFNIHIYYFINQMETAKKMIGQNEKRTKTESIKASQLGSHYHESGVSVICDQSKHQKKILADNSLVLHKKKNIKMALMKNISSWENFHIILFILFLGFCLIFFPFFCLSPLRLHMGFIFRFSQPQQVWDIKALLGWVELSNLIF